jgi:predicted nucleic acid-binding Zn ribbon protein
MNSDPERLRNLLSGVGSKLGISSPVETGAVWAKWREIVGATIADHADPSSLRSGVLRVRADSPAWATEIGYLGGEIKSRINVAVGSELVTEVRVWIGPRKPVPRAPTSSVPVAIAARSPRPVGGDPQEAFERARGAWFRRTRGLRSGGSSETAPNREKRR